jgi:hypothetical protein
MHNGYPLPFRGTRSLKRSVHGLKLNQVEARLHTFLEPAESVPQASHLRPVRTNNQCARVQSEEKTSSWEEPWIDIGGEG